MREHSVGLCILWEEGRKGDARAMILRMGSVDRILVGYYNFQPPKIRLNIFISLRETVNRFGFIAFEPSIEMIIYADVVSRSALKLRDGNDLPCEVGIRS